MAKKPKPQVSASESGGDGFWAVGLSYNKTAIVEASNEAEAWQKYKEVMGIRSSDHEPTCSFLGDSHDYDVDEFGIVQDAPVKKEQKDDDSA